MKNWKIIIEHEGKSLIIDMKASSYADAYIKVEIEYPGCIIKSISEIRS